MLNNLAVDKHRIEGEIEIYSCSICATETGPMQQEEFNLLANTLLLI